MTSEIAEKDTKTIQYTLDGLEVVRKKRRGASPKSQEFVGDELVLIGKSESPTPRPTWAGQPIVHAMYVRDDLVTTWMTGPLNGLPDKLTDSVLPGDGLASQQRPMLRLTAELWAEMRQQMDGLDQRQFDAERKTGILAKWQVVADFAAAEGWQ